MALIPMQDVSAAVSELRRAVKELGLPGAMLPSCGPHCIWRTKPITEL
jgi:hypothetical protein